MAPQSPVRLVVHKNHKNEHYIKLVGVDASAGNGSSMISGATSNNVQGKNGKSSVPQSGVREYVGSHMKSQSGVLDFD